MSKKLNQDTHVAETIWIAFAKRKLIQNPQWSFKRKDSISHYYLYNKEGKLVIDYPRFRKIVEYYFDLAKKAIMNGEALNLTNDVGKILGNRVERFFSDKKRINWGRTRKQPLVPNEEVPGKLKYATVIYFIDDDWCRIRWSKGKIANKTVYMFEPTNRNSSGTKGFKMEFSEALRADPWLKYRLLYSPLPTKGELHTSYIHARTINKDLNGIHININKGSNSQDHTQHQATG